MVLRDSTWRRRRPVSSRTSALKSPAPTADALSTAGAHRQGYQNLCRLISLTKLRVAKNEPLCRNPEEIAEYAGGLICLTGDEYGPLATALRKGDAPPVLDRMLSTFGRENVYAEIQRHYLRDEEVRNQAVIELAAPHARSPGRDQWSLPRDTGTTRAARRLHLSAPSRSRWRKPDACWRATASGT